VVEEYYRVHGNRTNTRVQVYKASSGVQGYRNNAVVECVQM